MELTKEKYKQTEVGLIPKDWMVLSIGDSLVFKNGLNKESEFFGYGTPIVNYMDVFNHCGISKKDIKGKVFLNSQELKNFSAKKGDVFFTRTSETQQEIGTSAVLMEDIDDCVFSGFILRGRPKNKNISSEYYQYCLTPNYVRSQIISTSSYTTRALTNGRFLSKVKIAIPPTLNEQKAIANALSDVDDLIANLDKLITKKKAIKQGAMQQLLTPPHKGGKRLAGFTGEWVEKKLGDVAQMNSGGTPSSKVSEYYNGDINWVSITDMTNTGKYIISSGKKITEEGLQNSSARLFPKDTVLLAMYASIGKCTIAKAEVTTSQAILGITVNNSLDIEYLYYYLIYKKDELISQGQQGTQSNLNKGMVQNIIMCLPQIKEQNAIAKILSDMDLDIEQLETKKTKYQDIKQGMMQELLTGKTRLV